MMAIAPKNFALGVRQPAATVQRQLRQRATQKRQRAAMSAFVDDTPRFSLVFDDLPDMNRPERASTRDRSHAAA